MPAIHGSLTDQDFDAYGRLAASKGMTRTELTTALAKSEIHRLSNLAEVGAPERQ
jgi:hypothetical protein